MIGFVVVFLSVCLGDLIWVFSAVYSASDHFRAKDYETSAEMFEKSMLYIPHDIENRVFRAKGFRVLCLCYLGLSQLDRALEYIEEAEKVYIYPWNFYFQRS